MATPNPFANASKLFGAAYNNMEQASNKQEEIQSLGGRDSQYGADAASDYLYGAVPPKTGPFSEYKGPSEDVENVKEELLLKAQENRPSNGSLIMRAGGGTNPAVKQ